MQPYLSIVATSRNDDHGGNLVGRMQAFANNVGALAERCGALVELIIVEWNPPADKPKLAEAVKWPSNGCVRTRIIEVPNNLHSTLKGASKLPLYQMIGKNVGIRRAQGDYILATNVDVLFPERFFRLVAQKAFKKDILYRTDRFDVDRKTTEIADVDQQLDACQKSLVALQRKMAIIILRENQSRSPGSLRLAGVLADIHLIARRGWAVIRLTLRRSKNIRQLNHHRYRVLNALRVPSPLPHLHLNACGDFQLMHKDNWNRIQGYYEFDGYSMHLDSCAEYAAFTAGIAEQVLSFPVYHIDHTGGWTVQTDVDGSFDKLIESKGVTYVNLDEIEEKVIKGPKGKAVYENSSTWGYADRELDELVVDSGDST